MTRRLTTAALLLVLAIGCQDSTAPPGPPPTELSVDVDMPLALEEVFLRIKGQYVPGHTRLYVFRGDSLLTQSKYLGQDTTIVDIGLQPAKTYAYRVLLADREGRTVISDTIAANTLDTTEHDIQWEEFSFGVSSRHSSFFDVAILSPTDIWAVGEVITGVDSNGAPIRYNGAHWNGSDWQLLQIPMLDGRNTTRTDPTELRGIAVLAADDIWVTTGWQVAHWNGQEWGRWKILFNSLNDSTFGQIIRFNNNSAAGIWGSGYNANVYRYLEGRWTREKIHPSDLDFANIWVSPDGTEAWTCSPISQDGTHLFHYREGGWQLMHHDTREEFDLIREDSLSGEIMAGVCFSREYFILSNSASLYRIPRYPGGRVRRHAFPGPLWPTPMRAMAGTAPNNITFVGDLGGVVHFNGASFQPDEELLTQRSNIWFLGVDQAEGMTAIVGNGLQSSIESKAVIFMGIR